MQDWYSLFDKHDNILMLDAHMKADSVVNDPFNQNIICSISGGSDSDVVLDIIHRVDRDHKVQYVWFDTGLEYEATKRHLNYLEDRYNIKIQRERAVKPIPLSCKEYGQPFISKYASENLSRLQRHGFQWEDGPVEVLIEKYPDCKSSIKWWCNCKSSIPNSTYNIDRNKYLKQFIIKNPPDFKISNLCCKYAKKDVAKKYYKDHDIDLDITGIRKSEGGVRSISYKNCYSQNTEGVSHYRPIFWFTDDVKREYEQKFNIRHSECYTKYGFKRTGCSGCPYSRKLFDETATMNLYEPKLYKAVSTVFKDSYEYTRKYREFQKEMKLQEKMKKKEDSQVAIDDMPDANPVRGCQSHQKIKGGLENEQK